MSGRFRGVTALALALGLLAAACGGEGSSGASPTDPPPTAPTTSIPPGGRQPTARDPLRVTFAGDSVMGELAPAMIEALESGGAAEGRFVLAPSLARDGATRVVWSHELQTQDPDLIVLLVGFWEDKIVGGWAYRQPGWMRTYRAEVVDPFLDLLTSQGAKVLWVGMAAVVDPEITSRLVRLNAAWQKSADERDDVDYLPGGQYLSGPAGGYAETAVNALGAPVRLRRVDGLHLCPEGVVRLGAPVLEAVHDQWNVPVVYGWQQGRWRRPPLLHAPEECPPPV